MKEAFGLLPRSYSILLKVLGEWEQIEEAVLFGSRAMERERRGSDVDLVLKGRAVTPLVAMDVAGRLNEREPTPYHFDILAWDEITSPELKDHIARVGRVIYRAG